MRLSPDQINAVRTMDITAGVLNMPTYTTLLMAIEDINMKVLRAPIQTTEGTTRSKLREIIDATGVFLIYWDVAQK